MHAVARFMAVLIMGLSWAGWELIDRMQPALPPPAAASADAGIVAPIGVLRSAPSLSAAQIDAILASYGSPAMGSGHDFYNFGVQWGIDPAYALAFFVQESSAGTDPRWDGLKSDGSTTHDIGNISCGGGFACYGRWRDYPDWKTGIDDWFRLIHDEYIIGRGHTTVDEVIPIYAPAFENDVGGYTNTVNALVGKWRAETPASAPDQARAALVNYALALQGIPYVRGGRSASGGDCSGTMQHIYLTITGIDIGGTTFSQWPQLQPTDDPQPGDLAYFAGFSDGDEHVGMVADVNGDGSDDLINNGGHQADMHVDYSFMDDPYFQQHFKGYRRAL